MTLFLPVFWLYAGGRSEEQALLCRMLQIPLLAQAVPSAPQPCGMFMGRAVLDVGTLPKKRNLKNTGLAGQAKQFPAPLAFSKLPSQPPLCILKEKHKNRKSIFKLILHMEKQTQKPTKLPMEKLLLIELKCPCEHSAAPPEDSLCCSHSGTTQVKEIGTNLLRYSLFSMLSFVALLAPPHVLSLRLRNCCGRGKMNLLAMKLI